MKLIRGFILFVAISLFVGIGSAFNGQSTDFVDKVDEQVIENEQETNSSQVENVESSKVDSESTETVDKSFKSEEKTTSDSSNVKQEKKESTEKVETNKKEEQQTVDKKENTNNSKQETKIEEKKENNTTEKKQEISITPPIQEEPKKIEVWDELGITEYEYYHSPMISWQKVTHMDFNSCYLAGEDATSFKVNEQTGEWYQDYTDYWCYEVKSYSGDLLGVMLSLS